MACDKFSAIANKIHDLFDIGISSYLSWALASLVYKGMPWRCMDLLTAIVVIILVASR